MKKILVIEGNKSVRDNIAGMLEISGYEVETTSNGKLGLEKAQSIIPDLIICDVAMPVLDGFSVLRLLSNNSNTAGIPFIFLTAKVEQRSFRKGMNLGADDYIAKPFDKSDLLNSVELRLKKNEHARKNASDSSPVDFSKTFFDSNELNELKEMASNFELKKYFRKEKLFSENSHSHELFFIQKGKVKTYNTNEDGKKFISGVHGAGDFLGYMSLLENTDHYDTAEALEDCEVSLIPKKDFFQLIFGNAEAGRKFMNIICHNLHEKESRLLTLAYDSVRQRVAKALLELQIKYHTNLVDNASISSFSREDLANLVGTAKETLVRTLSEFKDEGAIEIIRNTIKILDQNKLEKITL